MMHGVHILDQSLLIFHNMSLKTSLQTVANFIHEGQYGTSLK